MGKSVLRKAARARKKTPIVRRGRGRPPKPKAEPPTVRARKETPIVRRGRGRPPKPKAEPPTVHILIRVRSEAGQTLSEHARVLERYGVAMLGKFGQPIGPEFRETLNRQLASGITTCLFLTTREGWGGPYVTYRCPLRQVRDQLTVDEQKLVPGYYAVGHIKTWFEISGIERLSRDDMNRIAVHSTGRSIMSVIASSAAYFRVVVEPSPRAGRPGS